MATVQLTLKVPRAVGRAIFLAPLTIAGGIVVLFIAGSFMAHGFLAPSNVLTLVALSAYLGIAGIGETLVIITGGIDLSIAWTVTAASIVFTGVSQGHESHLIPGLAAALSVGALAGLANGLGVTKLRISPIVMTLGMNNIMQGLTLIYSQGTPSGTAPPIVRWIATGSVGPIPIIVLVWIILAIVVSIGLHASKGGRHLYSVGESPVVSRLSGINNDLVLIVAYMLSGLCAAVTGILFTGFSSMSFLGMGDQFVLPSIAAVVLGGASIYGGRGSYAGTFVGAIFLTVLTTVLTIVNIAIGYRNIIYGFVIIAAVLLYRTYTRDRE
ncbi:MAG TPA: ABC transporter permease [Methylocella sp.]|nr:ABC transporter permease [Methylocella sp.]